MDPIDSTNPFASPLAGETPRYPVDSETEAIRRKYLSHEASVQSIGVLYLIGGIFSAIYVVLGAVGLIGLIGAAEFNPSGAAIAGGILLLVAALTWLQLWSAFGLRRLDPRVRSAATIVALFGLIGFPIGTLISCYFLWLLHSKKGKYVFSPEYREVIDATPHIKYKTSIIVWIFLALLLGLILFGVLAAVLGASGSGRP
jgi:hypothetical protein